MIGVKFNGRLGNQIFQLAFFQYLRSHHKNTLMFFLNPQEAYLTKYFELDSYAEQMAGKTLTSFMIRVFNKIFKLEQIYIQNIQVPREVNAINWKVYKGYYQTDFYVKRIIGDFKIQIKPFYQEQFNQLFGDLFRNNKVIVVHIRRTDYLNYGKRDISLPMEYFKARLDALGNIDDYKVIFVSDDMEHVKSFFEPRPNFIFSSNSEIVDFQIIKNADIAIISNSSFAWWACYLSEKKNSVYAPKYWLGFRLGKEHPKKVMTDRFTWCDVL